MEKDHCQKSAEQNVSCNKGGAGLTKLYACAAQNFILWEQTRYCTHVLSSHAHFPGQVDSHKPHVQELTLARAD